MHCDATATPRKRSYFPVTPSLLPPPLRSPAVPESKTTKCRSNQDKARDHSSRRRCCPSIQFCRKRGPALGGVRPPFEAEAPAPTARPDRNVVSTSGSDPRGSQKYSSFELPASFARTSSSRAREPSDSTPFTATSTRRVRLFPTRGTSKYMAPPSIVGVSPS